MHSNVKKKKYNPIGVAPELKEDAFRTMSAISQPDIAGAVREIEIQMMRSQQALISFQRQLEALKSQMVTLELGPKAFTEDVFKYRLGAKDCEYSTTGYHVYKPTEGAKWVCIKCNRILLVRKSR